MEAVMLIHDRLSESNDRLHMIELDIGRLQKYVGVIARSLLR